MSAAVNPMALPIIWCIGGLDTAGGAGLSADQRAAEAMGVHACPVAACLTAQHSRGVSMVQPVDTTMLDAQLLALAQDMPPVAIKTGLLGSAAAIHTVARWVDALRQGRADGLPALVVDPVLSASAGGAAFSDEAIVAAYRTHLLPRATVITPNRAEAAVLAGADTLPAVAQDWRQQGVGAVLITGGDTPCTAAEGWCLDWMDTPQAQGWLCAPRVDTPHHHGTGCTLASGVAAALALGHVAADAIVLANLLTRHALMHGHPAGQGAGPVKARAGFAAGPALGGAPMPWLGWGADLPWRLQASPLHDGPRLFQPFTPPHDGLYGIVATADMAEAAMQAGMRCVQLRHKARNGLEAHLTRCLNAAARHGATLIVNDHWRAALAHPVPTPVQTGYALGLHLGQEDLLALSADDQALLRGQGHRVQLGLSSHSLWELARALGCGPSLIACGPVQATTTKHMPWQPQGRHNLSWWVAHSPVPVVGIGGLLTAADLQHMSGAGAAALCVVRALGQDPTELPARLAALRTLRLQPHGAQGAQGAQGTQRAPALPHPVL